ncbi:unnamed protein product [Rotaria sp. Silwood1]|nr:unnamed protein product [Rotaria sp. Silwood1]
MSFPDIRTLLSFWRMDKWFTDSSLYLKAEKETIRILRQDFHLELKSNESFELLKLELITIISERSVTFTVRFKGDSTTQFK